MSGLFRQVKVKEARIVSDLLSELGLLSHEVVALVILTGS